MAWFGFWGRRAGAHGEMCFNQPQELKKASYSQVIPNEVTWGLLNKPRFKSLNSTVAHLVYVDGSI